MKNSDKNKTVRLELRKKMAGLKRLHSTCIKHQMHYYRYANADMVEVFEDRIARINDGIWKTSIALKPLNDELQKEYNESPEHKFMESSKGLSGREILILTQP